MKASKFTVARRRSVGSRAGQGSPPVADIRCKAGISRATCFNRKKKHGGLLADEMRRLKQF